MRRNTAQKKWRYAATATVMMACAALASAADIGAPDDPSQKQATPTYKSAFTDYRSAADEKQTPVQLWRSANDEMGRLKGHAGQIRETPPAASPDAHSGHHSSASKDTK